MNRRQPGGQSTRASSFVAAYPHRLPAGRRTDISWRLLIACLGALLWQGTAIAADWPQFRADAARSGYTPENVPDRPSLAWVYRAPHAPMSAWPSQDRLTFDRAYQPVIANGTLYFGSSADGKVYALDAASGAIRWTYYTDGPVRFAPAVWQDRVFVAGDDGWLIALAAADGKLLWRLRGGPKADMLLGNDRMISRWPARGGPVVADGILYFAAGIWPSEGIFLYALDPLSGKVLWRNDSSGSIEMLQPHNTLARSGVAAHGHLVVDGKDLLVPTGRAVPALFDRQNGQFQSFPLAANRDSGGSDVVAFDGCYFVRGRVFSGEKGARPQLVGDHVAVHPEWLVSASGSDLILYDRRKLWVSTTITDKKGKKTPARTFARQTRVVLAAHPAEASLIIAGDKAVLGAQDLVSIVDLREGVALWTSNVQGKAWGLAAAQGRLYVSTDQGRIYCFQDTTTPAPSPSEPVAAPSPGSADDVFARAAEEIIRLSGVRQGYCLDLGCGDGRLAIELAQRTSLQIYAVDEDPAKVDALRHRLDAAGLYGTRVTVHRAEPAGLAYPRWFADLVVSGRSVTEPGAAATAAVERFQRPCGGMACLGKPGAMKLTTAGRLPGAGDWTHQYADAANTLCSSDTWLKAPLAMLWFRDTDLVMPNRHGRGPAPLVSHGRMFVEGLNVLRAVNIYNGRTLWEFPLPGVLKEYHQEHLMGTAGTGSNFCTDGQRIYLAVGGRCLVIRVEDGSQVAEFQAPPRPDGRPAVWGFLACEGNTLLGSVANDQHVVKYRFGISDMQRQFTESLLLFALDARSGKVKWTYSPRDSLRHNAIAAGRGRVYLIDRPLALMDDFRLAPPVKANSRKTASAPAWGAATKALPGSSAGAAPSPPRPPEHKFGRLLALDVETGKVLWQTDENVFGTMLALSIPHDVLLIAYQPTAFQLQSERGGRMAGVRASDGTRLWDIRASYSRARPIINGRTIYAQPSAWDLLSGRQLEFEFKRTYGCGIPSASAHLMVFRSGTIGYLDLVRPGQTENYGGIRPGCWVNTIPAGGVALLADAASWCTCSYLNQATIALQTRED